MYGTIRITQLPLRTMGPTMGHNMGPYLRWVGWYLQPKMVRNYGDVSSSSMCKTGIFIYVHEDVKSAKRNRGIHSQIYIHKISYEELSILSAENQTRSISELLPTQRGDFPLENDRMRHDVLSNARSAMP